MISQDVVDPITSSENGVHLFLVAPLTGNIVLPRSAHSKDIAEKDLLFFMTRSYQALTYSDGGD